MAVGRIPSEYSELASRELNPGGTDETSEIWDLILFVDTEGVGRSRICGTCP